MKKLFLFTTFFLAAFSLLGSGRINATCLQGTVGNQDDGNCAAERVSFTGSGYPNSVHITVTRGSTGEVPVDTYNVLLTASNGMLVTKNVTTGGGN